MLATPMGLETTTSSPVEVNVTNSGCNAVSTTNSTTSTSAPQPTQDHRRLSGWPVGNKRAGKTIASTRVGFQKTSPISEVSAGGGRSRLDQPEAEDLDACTEHRSQPDEGEQRAETMPRHPHHQHRTHRCVGEERQRQRDLVEGQVTDEVVRDQECHDEEGGEADRPTTLPRPTGDADDSRRRSCRSLTAADRGTHLGTQIRSGCPTSRRIRAPDSSALGTKPAAPDDSMSSP